MKEDLFEHLQKLNWTFFLMIVILVILLFFSSVMKYVFVHYTQEKIESEETYLNVTIKDNTVQEVYGALRPIVVVQADVKRPSLLTFELISDKYNTAFQTPGYTTSFEKMFFIPPEAHSTIFMLKTTAKDKSGNILERETQFETKKVLIPKFNITS